MDWGLRWSLGGRCCDGLGACCAGPTDWGRFWLYAILIATAIVLLSATVAAALCAVTPAVKPRVIDGCKGCC